MLEKNKRTVFQKNAEKLNATVTPTSQSDFDHGRNSDINTTAEQLTTVSIVTKIGVLVKAANGNNGRIFVGNADVTADTNNDTDGFELGAGESLLVRGAKNVNEVYVIADIANQKAYWFVV